MSQLLRLRDLLPGALQPRMYTRAPWAQGPAENSGGAAAGGAMLPPPPRRPQLQSGAAGMLMTTRPPPQMGPPRMFFQTHGSIVALNLT